VANPRLTNPGQIQVAFDFTNAPQFFRLRQP
jgi:hypothetical protein